LKKKIFTFAAALTSVILLLSGCFNIPAPSIPMITFNPPNPVAGQYVTIKVTSNDDYSTTQTTLSIDGNSNIPGIQSGDTFIATWTAVKGKHLFVATVKDSYGHSTIATETLNVNQPNPPQINKIIWSPIQPKGGVQMTFTVDATSIIGLLDPNFQIDSNPLNVNKKSSEQFSATWVAIPGKHTIKISVSDKFGTTSSTAISFDVSNYPIPVIRSFTWRPQNPSLNDRTVIFKVSGTDPNGFYAMISVDGKQLDVGSAPSTTDTFTATWDVVAGYHIVKVKLIDSLKGWYNEKTYYLPVSPQTGDLNVILGIDPQNPVHGEKLNISAIAYDSYAPIEKMDLFVDNVKKSTSSTNTIKYTFIPSDGAHTIKIYAKDKLGEEASATKAFTVKFDPQKYPPIVSTKFTPKATVGDAKILSVYATTTAPNAKIEKVTFIDMISSKLIGETVAGSKGIYSTSWMPREAGNVPILITVVDSNKTESATIVNVKVLLKRANDGAPIIYPVFRSMIKESSRITLAASIVDSVNLVNVKMWVDNIPLTPSKSSTGLYLIEWIANATGTHVFKVYAEDIYKRCATSDFYFYVYPSQLPKLSVNTTPKSTYLGGTITFTATVLKSYAPISVVNFYVDNSLAGSSYYPPYTLSWKAVKVGTHILTAEAIDSYGNKGYSTVAFSVFKDSTPPYLSISIPSTASTNEEIPINITTSDSESGVRLVKVKIYSSNAPLPYPNILPIFSKSYENPPHHLIVQFIPTEPATYTVYVTAKDNSGNSSKKHQILIVK